MPGDPIDPNKTRNAGVAEVPEDVSDASVVPSDESPEPSGLGVQQNTYAEAAPGGLTVLETPLVNPIFGMPVLLQVMRDLNTHQGLPETPVGLSRESYLQVLANTLTLENQRNGFSRSNPNTLPMAFLYLLENTEAQIDGVAIPNYQRRIRDLILRLQNEPTRLDSCTRLIEWALVLQRLQMNAGEDLGFVNAEAVQNVITSIDTEFEVLIGEKVFFKPRQTLKGDVELSQLNTRQLIELVGFYEHDPSTEDFEGQAFVPGGFAERLSRVYGVESDHAMFLGMWPTYLFQLASKGESYETIQAARGVFEENLQVLRAQGRLSLVDEEALIFEFCVMACSVAGGLDYDLADRAQPSYSHMMDLDELLTQDLGFSVTGDCGFTTTSQYEEIFQEVLRQPYEMISATRQAREPLGFLDEKNPFFSELTRSGAATRVVYPNPRMTQTTKPSYIAKVEDPHFGTAGLTFNLESTFLPDMHNVYYRIVKVESETPLRILVMNNGRIWVGGVQEEEGTVYEVLLGSQTGHVVALVAALQGEPRPSTFLQEMFTWQENDKQDGFPTTPAMISNFTEFDALLISSGDYTPVQFDVEQAQPLLNGSLPVAVIRGHSPFTENQTVQRALAMGMGVVYISDEVDLSMHRLNQMLDYRRHFFSDLVSKKEQIGLTADDVVFLHEREFDIVTELRVENGGAYDIQAAIDIADDEQDLRQAYLLLRDIRFDSVPTYQVLDRMAHQMQSLPAQGEARTSVTGYLEAQRTRGNAIDLSSWLGALAKAEEISNQNLRRITAAVLNPLVSPQEILFLCFLADFYPDVTWENEIITDLRRNFIQAYTKPSEDLLAELNTAVADVGVDVVGLPEVRLATPEALLEPIGQGTKEGNSQNTERLSRLLTSSRAAAR